MRFLRLCLLCMLLACLCAPAGAQQFSAWSAPVNVGAPVSSVDTDYQAFETKDGLSLYFVRIDNNLQGGPQDIWVAKRAAIGDAWQQSVRLGLPNSPVAIDNLPFITIDGHWMLFNSTRADGYGKQDIYLSRRHNKNEDFGPDGWQEPVNLGPSINTAATEQGAFLYEDEATGVTTLYFGSDRAGNQDIYASTLQPDGTFGPATPVTEVNSASLDQHPTISRDGLTMYFVSDRPGSTLNSNGKPSQDIWVSTRASTADPWGTPENLDVVNARVGGGPVNSPFVDTRPVISFDGTRLYFHTAYRNGNLSDFFDVWVTTREKITGKH